ncbi:peptide MFS transporter [Roseivirga misakiensis]|uniref:Amino acid transporter n=1 Tax=Roseivirga misakiensis TaxID=1563681 RepID=A0A1E5T2G2_9BACT|nr:peptide MFS transporter [Roseivirga misakiensis]OEK05564.1 amino acid transporter [Roseivirga misakiensis]
MSDQKMIWGHPRGLATLFFTEMWERFSYYGMRALLILFMATAVSDGGLGFDDKTSGAIYGLYTMGVYLLALPGGWLADRLFGLKKSVWYGGLIIALGHFTMGIPGILQLFSDAAEKTEITALDTNAFFLGLILIVIGTGLLKPNISSIVGQLYAPGDSKRDAGFSIFYMGINIGALVAPILTSSVAEYNWHLGFGLAGFGMVLGLIQYKLTATSTLADVGNAPVITTPEEQDSQSTLKKVTTAVVGVVGLLLVFMFTGVINVNASAIANASGVVIAIVAFSYLGYIIFLGGLDQADKKKVMAMGIVFIFGAVFWSGFEQAGSTLNLFAERFTDRSIFGWEMPAGWFQSVNSTFIILFAPFFGAMWIWLARKNMEPSSPLKFFFGLFGVAAGFFVMYFAAKIAASGDMAAPTWLIFTYLFHTWGELSLSPVGLSLTTKLAPKGYGGQMMGIWFLSVALGNLLAGLIAGEASGGDAEALANMPSQYLTIVLTTFGAALLLLALNKPLRKLMGDVH